MVDAGTVLAGWFADLCVADVRASRRFYERLLGLDVAVDHGWYVELAHAGRVVLALVDETVPPEAAGPPRGLLLSFEVDEAAVVEAAARQLGAPIVVELRTELGQRHLMVSDPDGTIIDVIQRVPLTAGDRRRLAVLRQPPKRLEPPRAEPGVGL
jgi:catechol 2,3-dioxygenase-like lactoylglutathione lyase family enzyme